MLVSFQEYAFAFLCLCCTLGYLQATRVTYTPAPRSARRLLGISYYAMPPIAAVEGLLFSKLALLNLSQKRLRLCIQSFIASRNEVVVKQGRVLCSILQSYHPSNLAELVQPCHRIRLIAFLPASERLGYTSLPLASQSFCLLSYSLFFRRARSQSRASDRDQHTALREANDYLCRNTRIPAPLANMLLVTGL